MKEVHPYIAVVKLFQSLEFAQSHEERMEIVKMARHIRWKLQKEDPVSPPALELSELAQRILKRCSGMKLTGQAIARINGRAYGGNIRGAVSELLEAKLARKIKRNLYYFNGTVCPTPDSPHHSKEKTELRQA